MTSYVSLFKFEVNNRWPMIATLAAAYSISRKCRLVCAELMRCGTNKDMIGGMAVLGDFNQLCANLSGMALVF